ncbi:hypothetical protein [Kingella oralis]|uniref:hypothetical protein n=1 Tax=Kingella oralis TaxID=505 RepID=UPI002D7F522C|nr:hypothetical protein [Kingella oralis]
MICRTAFGFLCAAPSSTLRSRLRRNGQRYFQAALYWLNLCEGHPIGRHFRLTAPLKRLKP